MQKRYIVRSRLLILLMVAALAIWPVELQAQWKLQGGYSFIDGAPYNSVGVSLYRTLGSVNGYPFGVSLAGEGGKNWQSGRFFEAEDKALRLSAAFIAGQQMGRLHLMAGAGVGVERFIRDVEKLGNFYLDAAAPPDQKRTVPYVSVLVEASYQLAGPVRPFIAYRREYIYHKQWPNQAFRELWNIRRHLGAVQAGMGITF